MTSTPAQAGPTAPLWWSSSLPWELRRSASRSLWLELVLPGGLLKSHSHSAMRFRTASSSASMTKHFLAEGSAHRALEWHGLQGKANSVLSLKPASRASAHRPCEGRRGPCQHGHEVSREEELVHGRKRLPAPLRKKSARTS